MATVVQAKFYGKFFHSLATKQIDLENDVVKAMLCPVAYVPDQDTHQFKSDVTAEITGTGYAAGGLTVGPISITYDSGTNRLIIDGPDIAWDEATFAARSLVLYDSTPTTDATRPLIGYLLFDEDIPVTNSSFEVAWDGAGIAYVTTT